MALFGAGALGLGGWNGYQLFGQFKTDAIDTSCQPLDMLLCVYSAWIACLALCAYMGHNSKSTSARRTSVGMMLLWAFLAPLLMAAGGGVVLALWIWGTCGAHTAVYTAIADCGVCLLCSAVCARALLRCCCGCGRRAKEGKDKTVEVVDGVSDKKGRSCWQAVTGCALCKRGNGKQGMEEWRALCLVVTLSTPTSRKTARAVRAIEQAGFVECCVAAAAAAADATKRNLQRQNLWSL